MVPLEVRGTADVVLGEPVELPHHHLAYPSQLVVEVLFREFVDHRGKPATGNLELQHQLFIRAKASGQTTGQAPGLGDEAVRAAKFGREVIGGERQPEAGGQGTPSRSQHVGLAASTWRASSARPDSILGSFGTYEARWMTMTTTQTKNDRCAAGPRTRWIPPELHEGVALWACSWLSSYGSSADADEPPGLVHTRCVSWTSSASRPSRPGSADTY